MGRATRWLKRLFGTKKSLVSDSEKEQNTQAIAVATTTATTVEAKAAASVVRLTSEGRAGVIITRDERWAVVKIQKVFRGSLARKALRALKGIVKLQALVRGYLVRKRAAVMLHNMQTLLRVQTVTRSKRSRRFNKEYNHMFQPQHALAEVAIDDAVKRRSKSRQKHNVGSMSEHEDGFVYGRNDLELNLPKEKWKFARTPRLSSSLHSHSGNNRYYVMQSPGKSVCGDALCEYGMSSTPGYMEKTQSFKAKACSHSAPHQRSERKRLSLDEVIASRSSVIGESLVLQQEEPRYSCS